MTNNPEERRYGRFLRDTGMFDIEEEIKKVGEKQINLGDLADVNVDGVKPGDVLTMPGSNWQPGTPAEGGQPVPLNNYYTKDEANTMLEEKASVSQLNSVAEVAESSLPKKEFNTRWARFTALQDRVDALEEVQAVDAYTKDESNALYGSKQQLDNALNRIDSLESRPESDSYTKEQANYLFVRQDDLLSVSNRIDSKADISAIDELDSRIDNLEAEQDAYSKEESDERYLAKTAGDELDGRVDALESREQFDSSRYYTKTEWDASTSSINNRLSIVEGRALFDASQYYTKTQADNNYPAKAITNALTTRVTNLEARPTFDSTQYYTKTQDDAKFALKADLSDALTRITGVEGRATFDPTQYYTKTASDSNFALKTETSALSTRVTAVEARPTFDSSLYYNKTQLDAALASKATATDYPLSEYGMVASTVPMCCTQSSVSGLLNKLWLVRTKIPANTSISKIFINIKGIGALPGVAASGVAIYTDAGVLVQSVLNNAFFTSTGWKTATLTSTIAAQSTERYVYLGLITNFVTLPGIYGQLDSIWNGLPSTHRRVISSTGVTAFPASFTPASYGVNEITVPFIGLGA